MAAKGKDLTNEEREWLREWAYGYEGKRANGLTGVAYAIGYNGPAQLSRVLNDTAGGHGLRTTVWKALIDFLHDDGVTAELFELEAASPETRREMRARKQHHALRAAIEAEKAGVAAERGVVEVSG